MLKLAAIGFAIIMVLDLNSIPVVTHYHDYLLTALLTLMIQPWVARQLD